MGNATEVDLKDIDEAIKSGLDRMGQAVRTGFGHPEKEADQPVREQSPTTVTPQDGGPVEGEDEPKPVRA